MENSICGFLVIFITITTISGQAPQTRQCWNEGSPMAKSPYFVGNGFTCCNNILIDHPIKPKNEHWRKCMGKQHGMANDAIPTTMWNVYMCELVQSSGGIISANSFTYKQFETFTMKNYPSTVKDNIMAKDVKCEVEENAEIKTKVQKFEECFMQAQESACFDLAGIKAPAQKPINNGKLCVPTESLPAPNHAFETFAQPCCKGKELPYPLFDIFMDFDRFDLGQAVMSCSENYKSKLKQLSHPAWKANESLAMCQVACVHEIDGLAKGSSNFQDLLNFKLKSISNGTKTELISIISKYQPKFQLYETDTTMPIDQAGETISKMDEGQKILNYCKFQFEATAEAYRALYEYCYNAEYGNQFRDDIIKTTTPRKN